jgi:hypothetical protein
MKFAKAPAALCAWACAALATVILAAPVGASETNPTSSLPRLSRDDWRADLEFAHESMPKQHANLFHTLSREEFEASFDRLLGDVDRLDEHEIIVRLATIVAAVGDGHSRLTLPLESTEVAAVGHTGTAPSRAKNFRRLPLRLTRAADGYVVSRVVASESRLLDARLLAIDGHDIAAVEAALAPVIQRDNDFQLADWLPWFMVVSEVLHARGVSPSLEQSRWRFEDARGETFEATLRAVPAGAEPQWIELPELSWPGVPPETRRGHLWFADAAQPAAVYVRVGEIGDTPEHSFEAFAASLQAHLAASPLRALIVDLRGNPGGDNSLNPSLVRALLRVPWVSDPGALYVLVDGGTFSAAMNLAEDLERWLPAVFVGSGTGAKPNTYGDARKLVLPRSGLTLRLSTLYWQNHPNDQRAAIEPLIDARPSIADLRDGRDPAATALSNFSEATDPAGRWTGTVSVAFRRPEVEIELPAGDGLQGLISIRALGVESAPLAVLERSEGAWRGEAAFAKRKAPVAARVSGGRMTGWIEYRGNRFPFVATRQ